MLTYPWWLNWLPTSVRLRVGHRQQLLKVVGNSGWLLADKLARMVLGLLVGAWVARHLGPAQFGLLAYALANIAMFQAFASLGADAIIVRDISQDVSAAPQVLGSAFALRLGIGVVCWAAVTAAAALFGSRDSHMIALTAVVGGVLVFQAADVVDLWFQSQSQSKRTVVAKLIAYVISNGVKVALILTGAPLIAFAAVTAFEALAAAVALLVAYRRFRAPQTWVVTARAMKAILSESWPFMLSGLSIMIYMRADQILVKEVLGVHELGIYAAILPISQLWQVVPLTVALSIAPLIAQAKTGDQETYRRTIVLVFRTFFYAGVVAATTTWAISGLLVPRLFGSAFSSAVPILDAHSVSNIFCFMGIAHSLWLTNERRFAVRLCGTVLAGLVTIGLNLFLLPRVGLIGACYSAIVAQCIAAFLINAILDRRGFKLQFDAITFRKA